jgi:hypothetical protein
MTDSPKFSRPRVEGKETAELRGEVPRRVLDTLDAFSTARNTNRMELVNEILEEWADKKAHEVSVYLKVMRGYPDMLAIFGESRVG